MLLCSVALFSIIFKHKSFFFCLLPFFSDFLAGLFVKPGVGVITCDFSLNKYNYIHLIYNSVYIQNKLHILIPAITAWKYLNFCFIYIKSSNESYANIFKNPFNY